MFLDAALRAETTGDDRSNLRVRFYSTSILLEFFRLIVDRDQVYALG